MKLVKGLLALSVLFFCCGGGVSMWGWSEWKVGKKSTAEPLDVDLGKLESGERPDNYHLRIGPHYACYYTTIYSFKKKRFTKAEDKTPVEYAFYPIVSTSNPDVKQLEPLEKKYGDLSKLPDDEELPLPSRFVVLVKTKRFKTIGGIPDNPMRREESVQGLVINEISSLKTEEKKLIQDEFPNIDLKKVLVLEEGRTPSSTGMAMTAMTIGLVVVALGAVALVGTAIQFLRGVSGKT